MVRIRDFIENNENIKVKIVASETREESDPYHKRVFEGMLHDIPEELREVEVIREGFLLGAQINQLTVLKCDIENYLERKE